MDFGVFLRSWRRWRDHRVGAAAPSIRQAPSGATRRQPYPPAERGFPVYTIDELLADHQDLIRRIKLCYGADDDTFARDLMAVMRRYAGYVNLLPATADHHFSGPGGLLRMGLEIAFFALQASDGQIFSGRATITHRRQLEPRWRHATFIAGLCSELHRTLSHVHVTDHCGTHWPGYLQPLTAWLVERHAQSFHLRWISHAHETRTLGIFALPHIVPASMLTHLAHENDVVVPHLLASISGMAAYRDHNMLDHLVRHAAALVIDRDLRARSGRDGKLQPGTHLVRTLVDACRHLIACDSAWTPNGDKSRVWYGQDGLFMVWPNAAMDLMALLEADQIPGIPKSPASLLDLLLDAGVIEPQHGGEALWRIYPTAARSPLDAIKVRTPAVLLTHLGAAPTALPVSLTQPPAAASAPPKNADLSQQLSLPGTDIGVARSSAAKKSRQPARSAASDHHSAAGTVSVAQRDPDGARLRLQAPIHLHPALRAALTDIIATFDHDDAAQCCRLPAGVFVPLAELARRQVDPAMAIRALSELAMLVVAAHGNSKTTIHDFRGNNTQGIVIAARYFSGWETSAATDASPTDGSADAGTPL